VEVGEYFSRIFLIFFLCTFDTIKVNNMGTMSFEYANEIDESCNGVANPSFVFNNYGTLVSYFKLFLLFIYLYYIYAIFTSPNLLWMI
jgi:hypothetical protein